MPFVHETDASLTVNPADLYVTATANSKTYGATASDSGTLRGVLNNDGITASVASAGDGASASIGTYTISATLSDPNNKLANYSVHETDASLTVSPADLYVTATANSKTYGATASDSGTLSGVLNNDGITASFASDGDAVGASVGSYTISATLADPNSKLGNYTVHETDASLTAKPAPLTVTANNASRVYGEPNPAFAASYSGFVLGQGPSALGGALTFGTPATTTSPVGTYTITPSGLTANDYRLSFIEGTLTISSASTTVALDSSANPSISGQAVTFTATVSAVSPGSGFPSAGETVSFVDGTTVLGTGTLDGAGHAAFTTQALAAGSHSITAVYGGDANLAGSNSAALSQTVQGGPGKITGGGSVDSGVRNFGFVVQTKVQNGVTSSQGNLEFQDKAKSYNLHSTAITLIAVNPDGIHGLFQGTATLNGASGYSFTVQVEDRGEPGAGVDRFRIQIAGPGGFSYDSNGYATQGGLLDKGGNIQVHKGANTLVADGTDGTAAGSDVLLHSAGELLAGGLLVAVQDEAGLLDPAEQARIEDAIAILNSTFGALGVSLTAVAGGDSAAADIHIHIADTSVIGGVAEGVLGVETDTGDITLVRGWSWYTGTDAAAVGAGRYDFQTVVTHELGHALGLGHSADAGSVMYCSLAPGQGRRDFTGNDLAMIGQRPPAGTPHPLLSQPFTQAHGLGCGCAACTGTVRAVDATAPLVLGPPDPATIQPGVAEAGRLAAAGGAGNVPVLVRANDLLPGPGNWSRAVSLDGVSGSALYQGGGTALALLGGDGDDLVIGTGGRDVLIGGFGADRLAGNARDDILSAGSTEGDNDPAALDAVMAEWASGGECATPRTT